MSVGDAIVAIVVGVVAGAYAGLLGVGGGVVMVPAMVLLLDQTQHVAEGTSLLAIVGTSFLAMRAHRRNALVVPRWARLLAIGGVVGALLGSLVATTLIDDETVLRKLFGVFLLFMATRIAARRQAPPREDRSGEIG